MLSAASNRRELIDGNCLEEAIHEIHRAILLCHLFRQRVSAAGAEAAVLDFELQAAYRLIDQHS